MEEKKGHIILSTEPGSIAEELELMAGDSVVSINGKTIEDILDYRYLVNDEYLVLGIISGKTGEFWEFEIEKECDEDLGIIFEDGLMDNYRSCRNKCMFCFIDQLPKGMRDTLYFKDDDARLSFLQGNYITLTNMSAHDIERICYYKLSPINISIHTTNPELRCKMLSNRFAGEVLKKIDTLCKSGIEINGQIVLCKGENDGKELERTLKDIERYMPNLLSISVVPVGLTRFREGLYPLSPFDREDSEKVLRTIERFASYYYEKYGRRVVYASDEWYLKAERELPSLEEYEDFPQIENGVGMLRSLIDEVNDEIDHIKNLEEKPKFSDKTFDVVTGALAYPVIRQLCERIQREFGLNEIRVHSVRNDFFGTEITVSGLITGQDIIAQLSNLKEYGEGCLLLPCNMLRYGENVFLDDITVEEVESALQKSARIVKSSGSAFVASFFAEYDSDSFSNELNKFEM